jgi:hypothetical protein
MFGKGGLKVVFRDAGAIDLHHKATNGVNLVIEAFDTLVLVGTVLLIDRVKHRSAASTEEVPGAVVQAVHRLQFGVLRFASRTDEILLLSGR